MDIILLGITIVSLVVAFVMSMAAWRVTRDEKQRSAARVGALSLAAGGEVEDQPRGLSLQDAAMSLESFASQDGFASAAKPAAKAPWASPPSTPRPSPLATAASLRTQIVSPAELPLNQAQRLDAVRVSEPAVSHASGFLGAEELPHDSGSRQKTLAFAAVVVFAVLSGGLIYMMSSPEGTSAAAVGPNSPLELVSLSHQRDNDKLAVSGLVRNPATGQPVQQLSAVVFLFDKTGTFVTSARAKVDFLKLGAGDESPFVVSLDAPATVSRYRVSFRTDDGVIPHIDRRGANPAAATDEQAVNVKLK